jgi:hypothetical protein
VVEETVQLLEHLDARFVRIVELSMLLLWDFLKLVLDVIQEVRETTCFGSKGLVFAGAVAAF